MAKLNRTNLALDITSNIYTNIQKRIKGNTVRDRMQNLLDSTLNIDDDANQNGGYMAIDSSGRTDVTKINAISQVGKFLRDDGSWQFATVSLSTTPGYVPFTDSANDLADTPLQWDVSNNKFILPKVLEMSKAIINTQTGGATALVNTTDVMWVGAGDDPDLANNASTYSYTSYDPNGAYQAGVFRHLSGEGFFYAAAGSVQMQANDIARVHATGISFNTSSASVYSSHTSFAGLQYDSTGAGYVVTNQTQYSLLHRAAGDSRWAPLTGSSVYLAKAGDTITGRITVNIGGGYKTALGGTVDYYVGSGNNADLNSASQYSHSYYNQTNGWQFHQVGHGTQYSAWNQVGNVLSASSDNNSGGGGGTSFEITPDHFYIGGNGSFKGVEYSNDYSANYSSRSLVDKGWVTTNFAPITGGGYLPLSGGTMTGNITLYADASTSMQPVTLQQLVSYTNGLYDLRGAYDASTNLFPATGGSGASGAIAKADVFIITVAGTLGGTAVTPGDEITALTDTPGQTAGNWNIVSHDIGYTPLTNVLTSGYIIVGNTSNIATGVAMSGDITISNTGVTAIGASKVLNSMINSVDWTKLTSVPTTISGYGITDAVSNSLLSTKIYVGNGSNIAAAVSVSGDASLANTGAITINSIGGKSVTLGGAITFSGTYAFTGTLTNTTSITFPTSGTLATLAGSEALTNKTLTASSNVIGGVTLTLGSDAVGDTYYRNSSGILTRLAAGTIGYLLTSNGAGNAPSWQSAPVSLPTQTGNGSKMLTTDGSNASWIFPGFSNVDADVQLAIISTFLRLTGN